LIGWRSRPGDSGPLANDMAADAGVTSFAIWADSLEAPDSRPARGAKDLVPQRLP